MQVRPGTNNDVGREYQFRVITFIAASLSDNDNVQDFVIFSNASDIPGFDDLIVKVWFKTEEQPFVYLGQIKHRQSKINFDGEKHKLADYEKFITDISKHKDEINILSDVPNENIEFWFYSNNYLNKATKIERKNDDGCQKILCKIVHNESYKPIFNSERPAGCFKLVPEDSSISVEFIHRFHLFLNQSNNSKIYYDILELLEFSKESTEKIIKYVDKFLNIPKSNITGLTKQIFETEVLNIHVSSITVKPTAAIEINVEQARVWNKITLAHDVTLINDVPDIERSLYGCFLQQINDIYDCNFKWNDSIRNKEKLADEFNIQNFVNRSKLQQIRYWLVSPDTVDALLVEMWKNDDLPLILRPTGDISILRKYKHLQRKFIIIGEAKKILDEINTDCLKIFKDISSVCSLQLKNDLLNNIMVSLQGRNPVSLNDIIAGDERSMQQLTGYHILDLIKKRKIYLNKNCFKETQLMIFIIINGENCETASIDDLKNNNNANILLRCKPYQVNMYLKRIKSRKEFDSFRIYVLRQRDDKLEYVRGRSTKIRHFLEDQDGQGVRRIAYHKPIPIIGERLGLKEEEYITRHLRKTTVDLILFNNEEKTICLVYGDVNSLNSHTKRIIKRSSSFQIDAVTELKTSVMVAIPEDSVEMYWTRLCLKNHQLILFKAINGCLDLIKYRNIQNISQYIAYNPQTFMDNNFFKEITNNFIVISGEPGMGKSHLLHKLSEIYNERNYVLIFNLTDYRKDFQQSTKEFVEDPLSYLFNKLKSSKFQNFIESVYDAHKNNGRLTLFLDSFDEILPFYEKKVLRLLDCLIKSNIRVIICSRLISDSILVDKFEVQLLKIVPIGTRDLVTYLRSKNIKNIHLEQIPQIFRENPLYLKFLIFLHQDDSIDFTQVNIIDLYRKFIAKIVERYCDKYNQDYNPEITITTEKFLKNHRLLALVVVFGKEFVLEHKIINNYDDLENEFRCMDVRIGIVKYFSEGYPVFVHQTFAEFMAAEWLNVNLFRDPAVKIIYARMHLKSYLNVQYLFDNIVCNDLTLHKAILNGNLETIKHLCINNDSSLLEVDKCGRTALHLASNYCSPREEAVCYTIIEMIIKCMLARNYDFNTKDNIISWNWIDSLNHRKVDIIEEACYKNLPSILDICLTGQEPKLKQYLNICYRRNLDLCMKIFEKSDLLIREYFYTIVEYSMFRKRLDIACRLMELSYDRFKDENLLTTDNSTTKQSNQFRLSPLHIACMQKNERKFKALLKQNKYASQKDNFGRIPLHYSAVRSSVDVVTKLIDYTSDVNAGDLEDNTPLHYACRFLNVDIVSLLLRRGADINKKNQYYDNALHFAIWAWEEESEDALEVTKMFAKGLANASGDLKLLLCIASDKGFTNIVQVLIDNGANAEDIE